MSYNFNADEIFEMAEQLERNGAKFYRSAADGVGNPSAKKLLLHLASMEDEHEKTFSALRSSLTEADKTATVFDPEGEAVMYLRSLADIRVFFKKEMPDMTTSESRTENDVMRDILKAAIEAEKDSIVFYLGMKESIPESYGKQKMDAVIKEEMEHIRILSKELVALRK